MAPDTLVRLLGSALLALGTAVYFQRAMRLRGFLPPGLARSRARRWAAHLAVAVPLWAGVFATLAMVGKKVEIDPSQVSYPQLFALHALFLFGAGTWFLLGFAGRAAAAAPAPEPSPALPAEAGPEKDGELLREGGPSGWESPIEMPAESPREWESQGDLPRASAAVEVLAEEAAVPPPPREPLPQPSLGRRFAEQFGLVAPSVPREIGLGLGLGLGIWAGVLAVLILVALALMASGQTDVSQQEIPAMIPWLASRPILLRLGICLSAGFVEELFFRGFLQPRIGLVFSSVLFTLAHLSYGQPFLLVGVGLLSVIYGLLVRWRQSIWAAAAAHSLFDGIQLLVLVPLVVRLTGGDLKGVGKAASGAGTALLTLLGLC